MEEGGGGGRGADQHGVVELGGRAGDVDRLHLLEAAQGVALTHLGERGLEVEEDRKVVERVGGGRM